MKLGDLVTFLGETNNTHARVGIVIGFNHLEHRAKVFWLAYNSVKISLTESPLQTTVPYVILNV